ncbi:cation diffusion facilitator family transporter [Aquiflexum gelatinilyticum]|uniref:cation diffusion facilitator family transporter n=1 Tax=Aquiflexum gelatinilyticum TaxID=2961943 RepID=UPI00216A4ACC|nr:cation transporter [Aquiflexum gelatinilyticum]MCS4433459.1 cation transporter [Aquiflexum gelatinilyticum]
MNTEKQLLKFSVYGALLSALLAVVWGIVENSKIILFDGIYSLISVGLSMISLITASFMARQDFDHFPYGKEMIEPIIILGKFLVITILCLFALFSGISTLLSGGQEVNAGSGLIYAFIATLSCYAVHLVLKKKQKTIPSGLIDAESKQWLMDTFLSLAVLVGFLLSIGLGYTKYSHLMPYMDPLMVIVVSGYFLKVPITNMGLQIREVLDMKADDKYLDLCQEIVADIEKEYQFIESFLRVSKSGPKLFIEIDFVVSPEGWQPTLAEQDNIREEIMSKMKPISLKKWLNVAFTNDRKWAV